MIINKIAVQGMFSRFLTQEPNNANDSSLTSTLATSKWTFNRNPSLVCQCISFVYDIVVQQQDSYLIFESTRSLSYLAQGPYGIYPGVRPRFGRSS